MTMSNRTPTGDLPRCADCTCPNPGACPEQPAPLRDQLAEALYEWAVGHTTGGAHFLMGGTDKPLRENSLARADAVLPVVEAETAALRQRAEEAERQRDTAREALAGAGIVIASLRDQRDEALAAVQRVRTLGQNLADGLDPDGHDDDAAEVGSRILRTLDHSKESSR